MSDGVDALVPLGRVDWGFLRQPFWELRWRRGPAGSSLAYLEPEQVLDRLNEGCGAGNWSVASEVMPDGVHVRARLAVWDGGREVVFEDYGEPPDAAFTGDHLKATATDAWKRAAALAGVGYYLRALPRGLREGQQPPAPYHPAWHKTEDAFADWLARNAGDSPEVVKKFWGAFLGWAGGHPWCDRVAYGAVTLARALRSREQRRLRAGGGD